MRVLAVTLVKKIPPGEKDWYGAELYQRSFDSIMAQDWDWQVDHLVMTGGDRWLHGAHARSTAYLNIARKYERAREIAVTCGYDAIWQVESDIIVPPDALRKLAQTDGDIIYGLYVWRHGGPKWSWYTTLTERRGVSVVDTDINLARKSWDRVVESVGVGDGCTFIRRSAFTQITRHAPSNGWVSCDWMMSLDAQRLGLQQKHHLGVICGHIDPNEGNPRILWPSRLMPNLYETEKLEVNNGSNRSDQSASRAGDDLGQPGDGDGQTDGGH